MFFSKKKGFHLFESFLYKNGKAENMPVVAGRLVMNHLKFFKKCFVTYKILQNLHAVSARVKCLKKYNHA